MLTLIVSWLALLMSALSHGAANTEPAASYPSLAATRLAIRGVVRSHATADIAIMNTQGMLLGGPHIARRHQSASLSKAMMLVGAARSNGSSSMQPEQLRLLEPMIRVSDNDAANAVYHAYGTDTMLQGVAQAAHMHDFHACGHWACAGLSARDQAGLFFRLPRIIPAAQKTFALHELEHVSAWQRWGISDPSLNLAARGFRIWHKSGWRPEGQTYRFNQSARVCGGGHGCWAVSILIEDAPSMGAAHDIARQAMLRLVQDTPSGATAEPTLVNAP